MKPIHVTVTDVDIAAGIRRSCIQCPIALAVRRVLCAVKSIEVSKLNILIQADNGQWRVYRTPESVGQFIGRFDLGIEVQPFRFFALPEA